MAKQITSTPCSPKDYDRAVRTVYPGALGLFTERVDDSGLSVEQRNLILDLQVEAGREKIHGSYSRLPLCSRGSKQHRPAKQGKYKQTVTDLYEMQ